MTQERKTRLVARGGVLLSAALWLLIAVAAVQASPTAAPVNIDPPTITGTARVGEVLTAQNGTWENSPTTFQYRWLRCNGGGNNCHCWLQTAGRTGSLRPTLGAHCGSVLRP